MSLVCPACNIGFGFLNSTKEARVLSCGDTYCFQCINNIFLRSNEFACLKCGSVISRQLNVLPPNKLFYESQMIFKEHIARINWENPPISIKPLQVERFNVDYDAKCMNPFCMKLK